ncbi:MAG: serine/threonine-protein kinase [Gemmatimonadales bacterium]
MAGPGEPIGRYRLVRRLGRGGFGETFLAEDEAGRSVALKVLSDEADWKARELFEREGTVLATIRHPAIPEFVEAGRAPAGDRLVPFLAMEFVDGESLATLIERGAPLDRADVLQLLADLLATLEYLHTRVPPVLHRDIKPSNLIRRPSGELCLVDFGSVRTSYEAPDSPGSTVAGTYGYMPYEQYLGQASPASDLFAVGATFLHLVTGKPPGAFLGAGGQVEVPADLPVGEPLGGLLTRMLRAAPEERFRSAQEARRAIFETEPANRSPALLPVATPTTIGLVAAWPAAPRPVDRAMREHARRIAGSALELMDPTRRPTSEFNPVGLAVVAFASVLTIGILPGIYLSAAKKRRVRTLEFLAHGQPAVARIQALEPVEFGMGGKLTRVDYEFTFEDRLHRGFDEVQPWITSRWRVGDQVAVLVRPEDDYDSIVVTRS